MLASAAIVSFITFLGSHLNLNLNVPVQRVGLVFLLSGLTSLIGAPLSGFAADRLKKKTLLVVSGFLLAGILAVIPYLSLSLGLLILLGLAGFTVAFRMAPLLALTTELVASKERGTFLAVRSAVSSSGIAAATFGASYLYQSGGYRAVGLFAASLVLLSTFLIIFFVLEPGSAR
jgi:predicted MFS family arabinose efflux permease